MFWPLSFEIKHNSGLHSVLHAATDDGRGGLCLVKPGSVNNMHCVAQITWTSMTAKLCEGYILLVPTISIALMSLYATENERKK